MKKLLLSLMVLASLISCGKDNKVSSGTAELTPTPPIINGYSNGQLTGPSIQIAQDLIAKINNPVSLFGEGLVVASSGNSNQKCATKLLIIHYCYGSYSGGSSTVYSGMTWNKLASEFPNLSYTYLRSHTVHSSVNIATKQAELIQLLNRATDLQVVSGTVYYVTVPEAIYIIDVRYPIQANPSAVKNAQGEDYMFGAF